MILGLLRRDPTLRTFARSLPITVFTATALLGVCTLVASMQHRAAPWSQLLAVAWVAVSMHLALGGARTRCAELDLALPLSARRLWLAHVLSVILTGAVVMAGIIGLIVFHNWSIWKLSGRWAPLEGGGAALAAHLVAGLVLAVAVLQTPRPALRTIPAGPRHALFTIASLAGVLGVLILLHDQPVQYALLPLGAALLLGAMTYRALPTTFAVAPREAGPESAGAVRRTEVPAPRSTTGQDWARAEAIAPGGLSFQWHLYTTIHRFLAKKPLVQLLAYPFLVLLGAVLAGARRGGLDVRFFWIPITAYCIFVFFGTPMNRMFLIDALPVSRRRLFAALLLPVALLIVVGYAANHARLSILEDRSELITYRQDPGDTHYYLYVPAAALKIAWDGRAPDNGSPWGESHPAYTAPLYRGSRAVAYSPYHTPPGSTPEFVALQISRATEAVYGHALAPEEIRERYLEVGPDGAVGLKATGLTLRADHPEFRAPREGPIGALILLVVGAASLLAIWVYLQLFRPGVRGWVRKTAFGVLMFVLIFFHFVPFIALVTGFTQDWVISSFLYIVITQITEILPGGAATVWGTSGILVLSLYWLAQARFERIEVLAERAGSCLSLS